jgi:uncharacterized protein (TIGR00290 family)
MSDRYALLWSGGKDCALALDRARRGGLAVERLINFHDASTGRVRFHATPVSMLEAQALAIGIELQSVATSWAEMDERLRSVLAGVRSEGFRGVILGDIHLVDVRAWYEERVSAAGLLHIEPVWGDPPAALLQEFVSSGGRAVVTCVDLNRLDESWLGREINAEFAAEIVGRGVDPCGENGEYHSFAFAGPVFGEPVRWQPGGRHREGSFAQMEVTGSRMKRSHAVQSPR